MLRIDENVDLTILLQYGWESYNPWEQGCFYKNFATDGNANIAIIINPTSHSRGRFVINSLIEDEIDYDDSLVSLFEILQEVELLKTLGIFKSS